MTIPDSGSVAAVAGGANGSEADDAARKIASSNRTIGGTIRPRSGDDHGPFGPVTRLHWAVRARSTGRVRANEKAAGHPAAFSIRFTRAAGSRFLLLVAERREE